MADPDPFDEAAAWLRQLFEDHPRLEPNVRVRGLGLLAAVEQEQQRRAQSVQRPGSPAAPEILMFEPSDDSCPMRRRGWRWTTGHPI